VTENIDEATLKHSTPTIKQATSCSPTLFATARIKRLFLFLFVPSRITLTTHLQPAHYTTQVLPRKRIQIMDHEMPNAPRAAIPQSRDRATEVREMKAWAKDTKVDMPIPRDLLPLLARDDVKQMEIVMRHVGLEESGRGRRA
jgi:hypothetical protein